MDTPRRHSARSSISARRAVKSSTFKEKMRQMRLSLAPLVQITTGEVHPAFPARLVNFWLLTDDQLESLAAFYHQRTPSRWSSQYPCPVTWSADLSLEEKRRKIGRFIGLRGCDSPPRARTEDEIRDEARLARLGDEDELWRRKFRWYN